MSNFSKEMQLLIIVFVQVSSWKGNLTRHSHPRNHDSQYLISFIWGCFCQQSCYHHLQTAEFRVWSASLHEL